LTFSFLFIAHSTPVKSSLTPEQIAEIDEVINGLYIPLNNVTGLGLSVYLEGETVLSKGYGQRDIENGFDSTNVTLFSIGSITKVSLQSSNLLYWGWGSQSITIQSYSCFQSFTAVL